VTNSGHEISPLEVVVAFGDAWARHDLDGAIDMITEDCVFDNTDPAPDGTTYVGRDAIRIAWAPIFNDTSSQFEAEETFGVDDRVVQRWRYSWSDGHVRGVDVIRVRGGLVAEKLSYVKG
jgi:ketosteroid isomerase-like protein